MNVAGNPTGLARLRRMEEAADWLLRMQRPERSEEELHEWLSWIDADPQNFAEFERLQQDWKDIGTLAAEHPATVIPAADQTNRAGRRTLWAAAAAVVLAAGLGGGYRYLEMPSAAAPVQLAADSVSESTTLPDGSKLILGAQSRIDMDFNGPQRQLTLSSGEAYFKVKHDPSHPFVVRAGDVSVTAVGTAFDVRRDNDNVIVTIEEGTVDVRGALAKGKSATWRVKAGYQVSYSTQARTAAVARVDSSSELAWRNGDLSYVREPLGSVVEDLNRYSRQKILITDPKVAQLRFTGTAFAASVKDWAAGIQQVYPVTLREDASGALILEARH